MGSYSVKVRCFLLGFALAKLTNFQLSEPLRFD